VNEKIKMRKIINNKRGISELISYVLLITLAIAIAGGTFVWLKYIAVPPAKETCPEVNVIILNDTCYNRCIEYSPPVTHPGNITFWIKNNGNFDVDGFKFLIANYSVNPLFKDMYIPQHYNCYFGEGDKLDLSGCNLSAGESIEMYGFYYNTSTINLLRITPFKTVNNNETYCKSFDFIITNCQEVNCGGGNT
jgi:hypothetical protein